jgi:glutathionyl-hydroquinone reductase
MGRMVNGEWKDDWYEPDAKGNFVRPATQFRQRVEASPDAEHPAVAGRYHLYVSYACPWAHRTLIVRALRGLEDAISVTVVDPHMGENGWPFSESDPDPIHPGARYLHEVYRAARPDYTGRVTVPVLWDRATNGIVCNESREVMRMLDVAFDALATKGPTLAPAELVPAIDETLDAIYQPINNGVYRAGFATRQDAYEKAVTELFAALDHWEGVLGRQRFLCGERLTEADVALFTTLLRFDLVYHGHFKCNVRRIQDYPALFGFLRDLYQRPEIRGTCHLDHIKTHYYWSQDKVNPTRIVPVGPHVPLDAPHDRDRL